MELRRKPKYRPLSDVKKVPYFLAVRNDDVVYILGITPLGQVLPHNAWLQDVQEAQSSVPEVDK